MENIDDFIKKVGKSKKEAKFDLSKDEDLSLAIMNLVSIEEHFFFTGLKTKKDKYFDLLKEVREMRKTLMQKLAKDYEGEIWCITKHLLAASMRLFEVGTKLYSQDKKDEAKEMFQKSYDLYSLFWGVNLKMVDAGKIEKIDDNALDKNDNSKRGVLDKLKNLVQKVVDCCRE